MTSSGVTTSFNPAATDIVSCALRKLGVIAGNASPLANQMQSALDALNGLTKRYQAKGYRVWATEEGILFPQPGQNRYIIGNTGTLPANDHVTDAYSYANPTLTATKAAGQTVMPVSSITGISNGDFVGVTLDTGTIFWTTVNGVPAGLNVTLTVALPSQASSGNEVYTYTTKISRPLRITSARGLDVPSAIETDIEMISESQYQSLSNKLNTGPINQAWYQPKQTYGQLFIYSTPPASVSNQALRFTWHRALFDWTSTAVTADFPIEWMDCLVFNLAVSLSAEYGVPDQIMMGVRADAKMFEDEVAGWDRTPEPIYFQPADNECES